jgi:hypothetical protein
MRQGTHSPPRVLHEIHVTVVDAEDESHGVAELWSAGEVIGFTCIEDGELALRLDPHHTAPTVDVRSLVAALAEAGRHLHPHPHSEPARSAQPAAREQSP